MIKKIIVLALLISMNFIFADCINLSKYPCKNTKNCNWMSSVEENDCSYLEMYECTSNINCNWSIVGDICEGGSYTVDNSYCYDEYSSSTKSFGDIAYSYVQGRADEVFIEFLLVNGFKQMEIDNKIVFKNKKTLFSYDNLILNTTGLEFKNLKIEHEDKRDEFLIIKFDSISINISLAQLVYIFEDLINNKFDKIDSFDFTVRGAYLYATVYDIDEIEMTLAYLNVLYDGYISESIFNKIERYGIFPESSHIFKTTIRDYKLNKLVTTQGEDMLKNPISLSEINSLDNLFEIKHVNFDFQYLPNLNKLSAKFDFNHPYVNASADLYSKIKFSDDYNFFNSEWTNNSFKSSFNLRLPVRDFLNMDNFRGVSGMGEVIPTKLPENINFNANLTYRNDIIDYVNHLNKSYKINPNIFNNNLLLNVKSNVGSFSFDVVSLDDDYRPDFFSYESFNINAFRNNLKVQNGNLYLNSYIGSNLFKLNIIADINLLNGNINTLKADMMTLNPILDKYITLFNRESDISIINTGHDIKIEAVGNLVNYKINGVTFDKHYAKEFEKNIYDIYYMLQVYKSEIGEFPSDMNELNEVFGSYYSDFLTDWDITFDVIEFNGTIEGEIIGESTQSMKGGSGKVIILHLPSGELEGYGQ